MSGADDDAQVLARERERQLAMLREIPGERQRQAEREQAVVHYARQLGIGWDDIAAAIGTTAGAALARYGDPDPGAEPF